jgi:hypothetical protein
MVRTNVGRYSDAMKQALIKTEFPSSVETAKRLGISRARRKELFGYVDSMAEGSSSGRKTARRPARRKVK